LVIQIWFASENDDNFFDPEQVHQVGGFVDAMNLPRMEEVQDRLNESSNYVHSGYDNLIVATKEVDESMETEAAETPSAAALSADNGQNYTQNVSMAEDLSAAAHHYAQDNASNMSNRSDKEYDCSVVWIRIPKTASSSIYKSFMLPLSSWFVNTHISPNICISKPGGCSLHWNLTNISGNDAASLGSNNESTIEFETACMVAANGGCFEYDNTTRTTNFGPPDKLSGVFRKSMVTIGQGKADLRRQFIKGDMFIRRVEHGRKVGVFSPLPQAHVGLHTSLFNNVLPSKPMVFCAFREPKERLLSSFHYGILYGANRPGQVTSCNLARPGWVNAWSERVADARRLATVSNDTSKYQYLLRYYLTQCKDAASNVYTQFLDPVTKDVSVALHNLEQYVIVGLQTNITETIQLWSNMTGTYCRDRPDYHNMQQTVLADPFINENNAETRDNVSIEVKYSVELAIPDVKQFDDDLKDLIDAFTNEDEVIYQRAKELYEEQRKMLMLN
jgi:hemerythrin superfamily protein